jgi:hypothetical protein
MKNSGIFKTMKTQWNFPITGTWLDGKENHEIFKQETLTKVHFSFSSCRTAG